MEFIYQDADGTAQANARAKRRLSDNLVPIRRHSGKPEQKVSDDRILGRDAASDNKPSLQQTLQDARERTNQANLHLQQFVYAVSHDFRTPLRSIAGFSKLLAEEYTDQLDNNGKDYVKRIVDGAVRMQQLIGCVTEFSRICSKEPEFVNVELNELMEHVTDDLHQTIKDANTVVTWDSLPTVPGDAVQLLHLFRHLFQNGIQFRSETPSRIHVSYEASETGYLFIVSDNGIGIDKKDHEHAFTMFRRIGIQDSESMGLGAGLTICRRIVERHGGKIKLESEPGFGTQVIFSITSQTRTQ